MNPVDLDDAQRTIIIPANAGRWLPADALRRFLADHGCRMEYDPTNRTVMVLPPRKTEQPT